ncbi:uncharacterized protein MONBRDRAFT_25743 [Monosiga brevicollis MX1]|uniref:Uncharacterized protein n=1 Tax=Monosiga brevicollis TaxID=81824 RepID=A9V0A7_MONBE|nr:uncharacterized protein MONBRDRAFT_25743 [Monosiga brevicollis MX1]EDQ88976.1 predicted protein [Monosiga brevicollis MX1]|eukprot:XP_001746081.1 hypothetical protein [Monosiga brevicollis MX1]
MGEIVPVQALLLGILALCLVRQLPCAAADMPCVLDERGMGSYRFPELPQLKGWVASQETQIVAIDDHRAGLAVVQRHPVTATCPKGRATVTQYVCDRALTGVQPRGAEGWLQSSATKRRLPVAPNGAKCHAPRTKSPFLPLNKPHISVMRLWASHASLFDPTRLNISNWVENYRAVVARSSYPSFQRDVIAEFSSTLGAAGLGYGYYYSTGNNYFLNRDGFKRIGNPLPGQVDLTDEQYNILVFEHVKELWTRFGSLFEIWFDHGVSADQDQQLAALLKQYQPQVVGFNGQGIMTSPIKCVGTESGLAGYPTWATGCSVVQGDPTANDYCPVGGDTYVYHMTVGNNQVLELDFAIDDTGNLKLDDSPLSLDIWARATGPLMEQMKQMQLQSTSEEEHRHIQAQIQALIELEQQKLAVEERKLEQQRLAEERKLEQQRLAEERKLAAAAEEKAAAQLKLKRKTSRDKIKVLKGMFANLGLQYEKALWNKLMAMDDDDFEAFVDEVDNMPSAERMNEVYPLEGFTWTLLPPSESRGQMPSKAPSQTLSLTAANELLGTVVAELPCSHHYLAAKIAKRIDELCADGQWKSSEALMEGLRWAVKAQRDSQMTELQQEPSISSRVSIVLQRYFGLNVVHQYAIGSYGTHVDWAGFDDNHHVVVMGECKKQEQPFQEYGGQVANELLRLGAIPTLYESNSDISLTRRKDILWPIININVVGDNVSAYLALQVIDVRWEQFEGCLAEILPLLEIDSSNAKPRTSGLFFLRLGAANFKEDSRQKEHDGFALARVMEKFLQDDEARQQLVAALEELQLDDAATLCQQCSLLPLDNVAGLGKATGSPRR